MLRFRLKCVPPTANHQRKKIVTIRAKGRKPFSKLADDDGLVKAKDLLDALLLPHQPDEPVRGPVQLCLTFTWPFPKDTPKRDLALGSVWRTSRPDCDNLAKTITDRLVALRFLHDDSDVAVLLVAKVIGGDPGIDVGISTLSLSPKEFAT